ncbi:uncharacterized protein B0H18DRAFT_875905 [Fomitopsis serialis]|uniref:uncharacterized protein n=1 Tax=Fomitopsis serialis TaxID=139415 RepID=UPI00200804CE|nr:uncharacterized protein B0H18DRAFT_875905 [Neoantrodia serialis]KAH9926919.1 hypothetical protein B0H18DRAFT_875905 [Neoantrodia serialis]
MTSRLKRKLNDLGVDPSSSKANESFCLIGTPLPPLEKSKDTGEFVPLWKQEVRDEKGRRRLHGAFTGGFSAGYFNSVGSKEGWAPSTFVSSRTERAKAKAARPEDFMDEEDLAELQDGRKLVDEHEEMDFGGTERELKQKASAEEEEKDDITATLEASLAPAPKDSVGARILKKMGWRLGQGVGPRLAYAQRRAQLGPLAPSEQDEDEEAKKHMYPRRDAPVLIAPRKDNFHGLGYTPGMSLEEAVGRNAREGPQLAAGFGLGALNDADEDDLDVYDSSMGTGRSGRSRMAYDAVDDEDTRITMGPSSSRRGARSQASRVASTSATQTFNDGRAVVKGFVLSDRPVAEDRWFPLPDVPPGWTPNPRRVWDQEKEKENAEQTKAGQIPPGKVTPKTHAEWKDSFMSADQRGSMLGETPLPSQARSVFDYMSQKDRERLQNIKNAALTAPATPSIAAPPPPPPHVPGQIEVPTLHPSIAKAALSGFQPFTADPVKQSRYTAFLNYQANRESVGGPSGIGVGPMPGQSAEEFNKELGDYAKSATVFKPLSAAMAGRFRSAVIVETGPQIVEGLHQPVPAAEPSADEEQENKEDEDPRMGAVRMGMYGPLTREVNPWQPARLLCKRFGVKDPEVDMTAEAGAATADLAMPTAAAKNADAEMAQAFAGAAPGSKFVSAGAITDGSEAAAGGRRNGPRDMANVGLGEDEDQGRDTLTYERPAMDIFKAIFASDDEDSDEEDAEDEEVQRESSGAVSTAANTAGVKTEEVPSHLALAESATPKKIDLATFKPTFVPRGDRESKKEKTKDKDKKDKKKKPKAALLTFDVDEDGLGAADLGAPPSSRPKTKDRTKDGERKKKKRKEHKDEDEDDSMWVEAPPPEVLKKIPAAAISPSPSKSPLDVEMHPPSLEVNKAPRARKRAIDFM